MENMLEASSSGNLLGEFIKIVAAIGISWVGLFAWIKTKGDKWIDGKIDSKFDKDLEDHKHVLSKELEDHKAKISQRLVLTTKQQEKEFEVAGEIWSLLKKAEGSTLELMGALQEYPDLSRISEKELTRIMTESHFTVDEIDIVMGSAGKDRQDHYNEIVRWHKLIRAEKDNTDLNNYNLINRPFINKEIYGKIADASRRYRMSLIDFRIGLESKEFKMCRDAYRAAFPEDDKLIDEIGELIQGFLHP
jgi:hypothetical protein